MFYVLIIMMTVSGMANGTLIINQEFTSLQKCEEAAKIIKMDRSKKLPVARKNISTFCVEK